MAKKKRKDSVLTKLYENPIEEYIEDIVSSIIELKIEKLKNDDIEEIVNAIIPKIEVMVSKTVLKHFKALAVYMQQNLKDPEEK